MNQNIQHIQKNGNLAMRMMFLLCSLLLMSTQEAKATHIVGGNVTYRCLGNNQYEIRLSLRRDCLLGANDAQFDDPASIGFFDATTNQPLTFVGFGGQLLMDFNESDTLNDILVSDCSIAGNPVCVHQTTYVDTIFLPFWQNGYTMVYQRCCRNGSLNNILNPLNTGMTLVAELSAAAQSVCKSSPQIGSYPPIYICVNRDINFIPNAFDREGDSLGFSLATPYSGGDIINNMPQPPNAPPYELVNWRPPYSLSNICGGVPITIDPVTGRITGKPNTIGQFIVTIVITSYRDGVELCKTRVDFQYNVRDCRDVPVADFLAPDLTCDNLTVNFVNTSQNADHYLWIFDSANPNGGDSTEVENPTHAFDHDGFYDVTLMVHDSDMICYDTIVKQIGVFTSQLNAEFSYSSNSCTDGIVLNATDLSSDPEYPIASWEWLLTYPGGVIPSTQQNPTFNFDIDEPSTVFLVLIVTDINGCTASEAKSFQVQELDIQFNPDADSICAGESVHLLLNGDSTLTYTWFDSQNGLNINDPWDPIAYPGISTMYYVTVTDGVCTISDSIHVGVQQLPHLAFTYETDCKSLVVQFTNGSSNGTNYHWDFGDPAVTDDTSNLVNPTYTYDQSGTYIVTLSSRDGCDVSVSQVITANAITEQLDEQTVNCFNNTIELNPDFNPAYTYEWSPPGLLTDPNSPNPSATVVDDTWFYVTISEASLPGCEIVDSILVLVPDDFDIDAAGDITSCDFDDVVLNATVTGNTNVTVTWKDLDGNVLGSGLQLTVNPPTTTSYVVMAMDTLGCMKSDTVIVLKPDPTFDIVTIPDDTTYCYIQTITIMAMSVPGVTFEWFNTNNELIGTGSKIDVTPGVYTCFYVVGTDLLGCQAADTICLSPTYFEVQISSEDVDFCSGGDAVLTVNAIDGVTYEWFDENNQLVGTGLTVTVSPADTSCYHVIGTNALGCQDADTLCVNPVFFDLDITGTNGVCQGDPAVITVTDHNGQSLSYLWDPTGAITPSITVNPTVTTTYTVTVTNNTLGCTEVLSYTVEVFSFDPPIVITADPDTVYLGNTSQLEVNQNPNYDYVWSASTGEVVSPIYNPVVTPSGTTTYCVTVTDEHGCTGTACITVGVPELMCNEDAIFLPNAFTPNGDGENDVLYVRSNFVTSMELNIYNRWGQKVFTSKDISIGWDGTFNGQELQPDVFGYYLDVGCPDGQKYFEKGNITLLH